jgi:mRNA degradation ribonuclease J1/J2
MNMMALRCGDDIIVIDAGMMFPESELSESTWSFPIFRT